jgi:putative DNA primase/helicase
MPAHVHPPERPDTALAFALRGWPVFPLKPNAKVPLTSHGFKDATTETQIIREWWNKYPDANIAIATGQVSGIAGVDVDIKNGAKGCESLALLKGMTQTLTVRTPSGGWHYYYLCPEGGLRSRNSLLPGIDLKADGGYLVAPGSRIDGKDYEWLAPEAPITALPASVLALMRSDNRAESSPLLPAGGIPEHERNTILTSLAGTMRRRNMSPAAIIAALLKENERCSPPLSETEVKRIAHGIERYAPAPAWLEKNSFKPAILAQEIFNKHHFLTSPIDEAGVGVRLHLYQNGFFQPNGADIARRIANDLLGIASKPDRIEATVALIKEKTKIGASELNPDAMNLLNVQNGMLDWRTGELKAHAPGYRSTFQINAEYIPGARSEILEGFLAEVFPPDALPLAEELVGYLLRPTTKFQKAFTFLGNGANGKSTFLSTITTLIGEEIVSHISLQELVGNRFVAAELQGKLVNVYADLPSSSLEQSDVFKAIVAGDIIKAERKFGQPFNLIPTARLLFSANELPRSRDLSPAYFRRWVVIPFPNQFQGSKAKKDGCVSISGVNL